MCRPYMSLAYNLTLYCSIVYVNVVVDVCSLYYLPINSKMGNDQPKKMTKATKGQIDIASLKAKIHLEMCRNRKNQEIIKG